MAECFIIYASVLVKVIDMPPIMVGFYRVALALPVFFMFASWRGRLYQVKFKDMVLMLLAGVCFGLDLVFFNIALHRTSVANVNLFTSLVCFILVPIGVVFFKEKVNRGFIFGALVAFVGIVVLVGGKGELSVANPWGDFLAFLACVAYSVFLALVYKLRRTYSANVVMFVAFCGSAIVLLCVGYMLEGMAIPKSVEQWSYILLICMLGQLLGQGFFGYIMGKISAQIASLLLLFTPIIAALMGYALLDERLGIFEIAGMVIIVSGVYLAKREDKA